MFRVVYGESIYRFAKLHRPCCLLLPVVILLLPFETRIGILPLRMVPRRDVKCKSPGDEIIEK